MKLLLDPPVGPLHPPEAIRAWLEELREKRERYGGDAQALADMAQAEDEARHWLEQQIGG